VRPKINKTPYEIWRGKKPTVKYFRTFGSRCYILCHRENLGNLIPKLMKAYSWGTPQTVMLIEFSIKE
jgi:hypothetical protein